MNLRLGSGGVGGCRSPGRDLVGKEGLGLSVFWGSLAHGDTGKVPTPISHLVPLVSGSRRSRSVGAAGDPPFLGREMLSQFSGDRQWLCRLCPAMGEGRHPNCWGLGPPGTLA